MKSKGFTLIELAVVLAIIAFLAAILTPIVTNYIDQARIARTMSDARVLASRSMGETSITSQRKTWRTTARIGHL